MRKKSGAWLWRSIIAQLPIDKIKSLPKGIEGASQILNQNNFVQIKDNDFKVGDEGVSTKDVLQEGISFKELDEKTVWKIQRIALGRLIALDPTVSDLDVEHQLMYGVKCIWY